MQSVFYTIKVFATNNQDKKKEGVCIILAGKKTYFCQLSVTNA
jgi:hypothetical protein